MNDKPIDWIKLITWVQTEKTKGVSESRLKEALIKQGYTLEETNEVLKRAVNKTKINPFKKYFTSKTVPVLIISIISYFFLLYSFKEIYDGTIFILCYIAIFWIIELAYYKNKNTQANKLLIGILIVINLLVVLLFMTELMNYQNILFVALIIMTIQSITYFFKTKRKHNFNLVFLSFFSSMNISLGITIAIYLLYANLLVALFNNIEMIFLGIIILPLVIIFIILNTWLSINILKTVNIFDYNSFFKFKYTPFKILNICSHKDNIKKSIIRITTIISIIILIGSFMTTIVFNTKATNKLYSSLNSNNNNKYFLDDFKYDRYDYLLEYNNFTEPQAGKILENNGKFSYLLPSNTKIDFIKFNCDEYLNCQEKKFDNNKELSEQISLKGFEIYVIAYKNNLTYLFLIPNESYKKIMSHDLFEFQDEELQKTKISKEINNDWQSINKEINSYEIIKNDDWKFKYLMLIKEDELNQLSSQLSQETLSLIKLKNIKEAKQTIIEEYKWIKDNEKENISFYDGTKNKEEHLAKLKSNVNKLLILFEKSNKEEIEDVKYHHSIEYLYEQESKYYSLVKKTNYKIRIRIIRDFENKFRIKAQINVFESQANKIKEEYNNTNLEESDISKILRLKILETQMIKIIIKNANEEEILNIMSITKNPEICLEIKDSKIKDLCIIDNSEFNKEICNKLNDLSKVNECLTN